MAAYDMAGASLLSRFHSRLSRVAGLAAGAFGSRSSQLAALAAWTLALWTILSTLAAVFTTHCDLLYSDEWDTWMTWLKQGYSLGWFFSEHNDHRIVAARVLFAIGNWAFHARTWFPQSMSFAVQTWLALLLWRLAKRSGVTDPQDSRVLGAAIACCLFSAAQFFNFIWGFQTQFFLVYAAGAAAQWALLRAAEAAHPGGRRAWMAACLLLATVCSYSIANGVLIWPILLLAAVRLRMGRAGIALLAAAAVLVLGQYMHGWHASALDAPAPAWRVALFAMANAGGPLVPLLSWLGAGTAGTGVLAAAAGGTLLAGTALQGLLVWTRRSRYSGGRIVLAHFTVFVAAACFAIAAGRAHLPLVAAFRSRYMTPPCILWVCLLSIAWGSLRTLGPRRLRWAVVAALLLGIAWHQASAFRGAREYGAALGQASTALAVGVNDPSLLPILTYSYADLAPVVAYLKEHRLAAFSEEWTRWPGQRLAARFRVDPHASACRGAFQEVAPVSDPSRPGWRVSGWARDASGGGPRRIVLADSDGGISGVALGVSGQWSGYARPGSPAITAYAVEPDGKSLCSLGTRLLPPRQDLPAN